MSHLLCFGFGYSARALAKRLAAKDWTISGTARTPDGAARIAKAGYNGALFTGEEPGADVAPLIAQATHILHSVPPDVDGDPVLCHHGPQIASAPNLEWAGYLSTVGVYGGTGGEWVDEMTPPRPVHARGERRVRAEADWLEFGRANGIAVHVFRLAGIYGPGRNAFTALREGRARRIVRQGQVFNRIHVEDIARALEASIARPNAGQIYNVADDEAAPPQDLITFAAGLMGVAPPPEVTFEEAELTPMARSFYGESKRVSNARIKSELGVELAYPTYREGLRALLEEES